MLILVKAVDQDGKAISSPPMNEKDPLIKVWQFKRSGYTQIRTCDARTDEEINIVRKPDQRPVASQARNRPCSLYPNAGSDGLRPAPAQFRRASRSGVGLPIDVSCSLDCRQQTSRIDRLGNAIGHAVVQIATAL